MGLDKEDVSTANQLNSDVLSELYSVKGVVLGLSQVVILVALVFGCHACYKHRRYRHKRRGQRLEKSSGESKENHSNTNGQAQVQPIFLDASTSPSTQTGTYGSVVMNMPDMDNMAPAPYAPTAPYVAGMPNTSFPAGVPTSGAPQYWPQQQQPFFPQAQPEDLPPAYHSVFPEKKS